MAGGGRGGDGIWSKVFGVIKAIVKAILTSPSEDAQPVLEDLESARRTRQEAFAEQDKARQLSRESQGAFKAGNGAEAKRLSNLKNEAYSRADLLHKRAELGIFAFYNDPSRLASNNAIQAGEKWVDFHELLPKEVTDRLTELKSNHGRSKTDDKNGVEKGDDTPRKWVLIVGRGNHSTNNQGHSVLRGTVEKWCHDNGLPCAPDEPTVGCVTVNVDSDEPPAPPCCSVL